ncbi:MAG TPA: hypothetical protein PKV73_12180 [Agriterribacter sp.]|nr:hypothetical protein [Agriterribacter sp.]
MISVGIKRLCLIYPRCVNSMATFVFHYEKAQNSRKMKGKRNCLTYFTDRIVHPSIEQAAEILYPYQ